MSAHKRRALGKSGAIGYADKNEGDDMVSSVAELSVRIVAEAVRSSSTLDNEALSPSSLTKLYGCVSQLIGQAAEEALWERAMTRSDPIVRRHHEASSGIFVMEANDNDGGAITVSANAFVRRYIIDLGALVGPTLALRHLEHCFPM